MALTTEETHMSPIPLGSTKSHGVTPQLPTPRKHRGTSSPECPALVAVDVVLIGGSLGEAGLLRRAVRDTPRSIVVHEVARAGEALAVAREGAACGRGCLLLIDTEGVQDVRACLRTLRHEPATAVLPLLAVGSGHTEDQIRAFYDAGASSVVERSHFLDLHLRTLRGVILYWLDLAEVVPPVRT
jgi:hypothetical protein